MLDKTTLMKLLLEATETDIANSKKLLETAQQLVNDAPGAMQSHSDTSRFQGNILARRQAESLREKQEALQSLRVFFSSHGFDPSFKIEMGAVFTFKENGNQSHFLLLPYGGGQEVVFEERAYCVITLKSPLTSQLIGKKVGDKVCVGRGGMRTVEITEIA